MIYKTCLMVFAAMCLLSSCEMPDCRNSNPIFDKYPPDADEYKAELVRVLKSTDDLNFWILSGYTYALIDRRQYMVVHVMGQNVCAEAKFDITELKRLDHFKKVGGYGEAKLENFSYRIDSAGGKYSFICTGVGRFID